MAPKNFARYAANRQQWGKSSDAFNEFYFKRAVARGLIFRATERIVSAQPRYNGGYRANIVAYTLAVLGDIRKRRKESIDFLGIWNAQKVDPVLESAIAVVSGGRGQGRHPPPQGISTFPSGAKEACWTRIQAHAKRLPISSAPVLRSTCSAG